MLAEAVRAEPGYVEPPNGAASERGRVCHELAEAALREADFDFATRCSPEQRQSIEAYVLHVRGLIESLTDIGHNDDASVELLIEERLDTDYADCWGTLDAAVINWATREAWIIDLKTGHQRVDAQDNPQLCIYALGLMRRLTGIGVGRHHRIVVDRNTLRGWRFHLQICQPNDIERPFDTWSTTGAQLLDFEYTMEVTIRAADTPSTGFIAGSWCQYCPGASRCPTLHNVATMVFDTVAEDHVDTHELTRTAGETLPTPAVTTLTPQQRAFFLQHRKVIRDFLDAIEDSARTSPPPGWKLVEGVSRRTWSNPDEVVRRLIADGQAELVRQMPPTITEAQRQLGVRNPILRDLAVARPSSPAIVPASDPRPALDPGRHFEIEHAAE